MLLALAGGSDQLFVVHPPPPCLCPRGCDRSVHPLALLTEGNGGMGSRVRCESVSLSGFHWPTSPGIRHDNTCLSRNWSVASMIASARTQGWLSLLSSRSTTSTTQIQRDICIRRYTAANVAGTCRASRSVLNSLDSTTVERKLSSRGFRSRRSRRSGPTLAALSSSACRRYASPITSASSPD